MSNKPNIVLITSDQHRGDALGCAGHPCVRTPHLDALFNEGIRFVNAYSNCPICIPARTSIITGRNAHANGCPQYAAKYRVQRNTDDFLGSLITRAGYQTQLIGKTHWHTEETFRAGFESVIATEHKPSPYWRERLVKMGRNPILTGMGANEMSPTLSQFPPELNSTNWIVDKSLDFLDYRDRTVPFFLWVSLTEPHPPNVIHEPYYSMYDYDNIPEPVMPDWAEDKVIPYAEYVNKWATHPGYMTPNELRKARGVYYGAITNIDHQLGRLFGKLIYDGLWDNTLIIYTTDHGEKLGDFGAFRKSSFTENAAQIPFIIKWSEGAKSERGRVSDALVELSDILPTLCDYAGAKIPEDVTGKSLRGIIENDVEEVREALHGQIDHSHMYHDGHYKYLYYAEDGKELLFDVTKDRQDRYDLSGNAELLANMRERFKEHLAKENNKDLKNGELLNLHYEKPPVSKLRSKSVRNLGLSWAGRSGEK